MFWQENIRTEHFTVPDSIQDKVFNIRSKVLPIDHSHLLLLALLKELPWLKEVNAGIHDIGVADGNGWTQDKLDGFYYPSKRSKLIIRMPKEKLELANSLVGKTLILNDYKIEVIKQLPNRKLSDMQILFAKNVACSPDTDENKFLQTSFDQLQELQITPNKMMAGLKGVIKINDNIIHTRSLMIADLKKSDSVIIQERGIGEHRLLGCGLFIPQKDIISVDAV